MRLSFVHMEQRKLQCTFDALVGANTDKSRLEVVRASPTDDAK
jgi:hypothetical protein